eukprot:146569-Pleurochrysis_carterae.AAC.1
MIRNERRSLRYSVRHRVRDANLVQTPAQCGFRFANSRHWNCLLRIFLTKIELMSDWALRSDIRESMLRRQVESATSLMAIKLASELRVLILGFRGKYGK